MRILLLSQFVLATSLAVSEAIQCFSCLSNEGAGKFCRKISEAEIVKCQDDATFCSALVFLKNGQVNVNRGCGANVATWGFGSSECQIMSNEALIKMAMALYQCRGDGCNNIEPADGSQSSDVLLLTKAVKDDQPSSSIKSSPSSSSSSSNMINGMSSSSLAGFSNIGAGQNNEIKISSAVGGYSSGLAQATDAPLPYSFGGANQLLSSGAGDLKIFQTKKKIKITTPRPIVKTTAIQEEEEAQTSKPTLRMVTLAKTTTSRPITTKKATTIALQRKEEEEEETQTKKPTLRMVTEAKTTVSRPTTSKKTSTIAVQRKEEEEEPEVSAYQKPPPTTTATTTTTTTKRRIVYPENESELKEEIVTERSIKVSRPSVRRRTVFDRRR